MKTGFVYDTFLPFVMLRYLFKKNTSCFLNQIGCCVIFHKQVCDVIKGSLKTSSGLVTDWLESSWFARGVCWWRSKEMFYLTTNSTHFVYGYMASDIWLRTILIVRKETRCHHIDYSLRLTARVLLYAPSHRQDSTYHSLCYTSRGALAETRNSSMGSPHEGSIRRPIAPWANALPLSYVSLLSGLESDSWEFLICQVCVCVGDSASRNTVQMGNGSPCGIESQLARVTTQSLVVWLTSHHVLLTDFTALVVSCCSE